MQVLGHLIVFVAAMFIDHSYGDLLTNALDLHDTHNMILHGNTLPPLISNPAGTFPCICGVFLNGQFIVKHLPNSPAIICGTIDRDCYKERAYLFIKNCNDSWVNTNLSAGREYCCKEGVPYKCPILS
ncbi:Follicle cell protein 3C-1 [Blattella germanica]|nr:Follicle cell protein 3C-1 [Blattella germanica]